MEDRRAREARAGLVRLVLALVIIELTALTAYLHLTLGGQLFTLNGLGYLALGGAYAAAVLLPVPMIQRFAWLPRIGLAAYTLVTIGAYLVMGPYFSTGWIAKGIEVAIVALLVADIAATYRTPPRPVARGDRITALHRWWARSSPCVTGVRAQGPRH